MTDHDRVSIEDTLLFTLTSSENDRDGTGEAITVVDALEAIAVALHHVAHAIERQKEKTR